VKIAITGSSGLIGSALVAALRDDGHDVVRFVRRTPAAPDELPWDPSRRELDPARLSDVDAVVNLAGAGIGDKRWTEQRKRLLLSSRVDATETVSTALAAADDRARILVSASAVGWYGDTGDQPVDESAPSGAGFLAELCRRWEAATAAAEQVGVRVAHVRSGLVCGKGGILGRLVPLVKLGGGVSVGSGKQYWPWISLADEVGAMRHVLAHDEIAGPVNLTGPQPLTNRAFTRVLAHVLHRPALPVAVPRIALRVALGEFADEGIVIGQRAMPQVLQRTGYQFRHSTAEQALEWATGDGD
jgi:uncharacterized protein